MYLVDFIASIKIIFPIRTASKCKWAFDDRMLSDNEYK